MLHSLQDQHCSKPDLSGMIQANTPYEWSKKHLSVAMVLGGLVTFVLDAWPITLAIHCPILGIADAA